MRPSLGITIGDPTGIGPEIVAAVLEHAVTRADVAVFGSIDAIERAMRASDVSVPSRTVDRFEGTRPGTVIAVATTGTDGDAETTRGLHQILALDAATDALLDGRLDCLCTGPVCKASIAAIRPGFTGHTEYLAQRAGLDRNDVTMAFANERLVVGLVSTHVPLRALPDTITPARYARTLRHVEALLARMPLRRRAEIAVAGFNPHAGEDGLLGREEIEVIAPFIESARARCRATLTGPVPADTVFRDASNGRYDAVIAAYHDQAMIPLKLTGAGRTVNITLGLPFVRTSPDHGTARDIAGKGIADPGGMKMAIDCAIGLCEDDRDRPRGDGE